LVDLEQRGRLGVGQHAGGFEWLARGGRQPELHSIWFGWLASLHVRSSISPSGSTRDAVLTVPLIVCAAHPKHTDTRVGARVLVWGRTLTRGMRQDVSDRPQPPANSALARWSD